MQCRPCLHVKSRSPDLGHEARPLSGRLAAKSEGAPSGSRAARNENLNFSNNRLSISSC